jgi:hypothetical protein
MAKVRSLGLLSTSLGHQGVGDHVPIGDDIGTRWRDQYRGSDYAQQQSCCRQLSNAYHRKAPPFSAHAMGCRSPQVGTVTLRLFLISSYVTFGLM